MLFSSQSGVSRLLRKHKIPPQNSLDGSRDFPSLEVHPNYNTCGSGWVYGLRLWPYVFNQLSRVHGSTVPHNAHMRRDPCYDYLDLRDGIFLLDGFGSESFFPRKLSKLEKLSV